MNSHKRLQHKFPREGHHSLFLQRSKHATWSNKWSYRLNNNNHMHHLLRKFNLNTYLHSQKQAQSNIQITHITSYCRRIKTKTCWRRSNTNFITEKWENVDIKIKRTSKMLIYL
jgi:hypothetical protein